MAPDPLTMAGELCTYLQGLGAALPTPLIYTTGGEKNLFAGILPDAGAPSFPVPDTAVAIMERPGRAPVGVLIGAGAGVLQYARPTVQVMTRTTPQTYQTGYDLAEAIFGALHGLANVQLNPPSGAFFHTVLALQSPAYLGQEAGRQRHLWSQNFNVEWEDPALG